MITEGKKLAINFEPERIIQNVAVYESNIHIRRNESHHGATNPLYQRSHRKIADSVRYMPPAQASRRSW